MIGGTALEIFLVLVSVRGWVYPRKYWGRKDYVNEKFQWPYRKSNPQTSGMLSQNVDTEINEQERIISICQVYKNLKDCPQIHQATKYSSYSKDFETL